MSFPRRYARTQRFTLGVPRDITVAAGGERILFLRSAGSEDPTTELWRWTETGGEERLLTAQTLPADDGVSELSDAERARRERQREMAEGVTAYATDRDGRLAVTVLDGRLLTVDTVTGEVTQEPLPGPAFDPRLDPSGRRIAVVVDDALHVLERGGGEPTIVAEEADVSWGLADFVAAEEMHRYRGHWWSPDGRYLAACRVDERNVPTWFISDPADPSDPPREHRYPAAGTTNPDVMLAVFDVDSGARVDVRWDRDAFPYLARVAWQEGHPLTLLVQERRQRRWRILTVDNTGATTVVQEHTDPIWVDLLVGMPRWTGGGGLVTVVDQPELGAGGTRGVAIDGRPATPAGLQVDEVLAVEGDAVWFRAFEGPFDASVWRLDLAAGQLSRESPEQGLHRAEVADGTVVLRSEGLDGPPRVVVRRGGVEAAELRADVGEPGVTPAPRLFRLGPHDTPAALYLPTSSDPASRLPVLLSPYGGPGISRARRAVRAWGPGLEPQWFADQGFAVLVVDNRGMPGINVRFEKAIAGDLASAALEDQVDALLAAAEQHAALDLGRVAIRGWSFGGFLAALAVLRRPDVFRAGIVGAPVVDWRLYDTHYTERYLGLPDERPEAYRTSSLVDEEGRLLDARPWDDGQELLVIHGLADDNVVAAHSLRLSAALFADGRDHGFLPLTGVTHMTPTEVVTANLLELQLRFLKRVLDL